MTEHRLSGVLAERSGRRARDRPDTAVADAGQDRHHLPWQPGRLLRTAGSCFGPAEPTPLVKAANAAESIMVSTASAVCRGLRRNLPFGL